MNQVDLTQAALDLDEQAIAEASQQISVEDLDLKIQELRQLDDDYKEKKRVSNEAHALLESAKAKMLPILEALGRNNYALPGVGVITRVTESRYKMPEDVRQRELLFKFIADKYGKDALYALTTIHHDKINNFVREEVAQGVTVPGVPGPTTETYAKFGKR